MYQFQSEISILIVDDNMGDQILLEENLKATTLPLGEIIKVFTLTDAIALLNKRSFALIFLDLFLPDSNGLDTFVEINKKFPYLPIIIYSGSLDTNVSLNAISLGAQDFLIKGDQDEKLLEKSVRYSIERIKSMEALKASNERFNLVSKATNDMVWDWDLVTGHVYRNAEGWKKIFKNTTDIPINSDKVWEERLHPEDKIRSKKLLAEALKSDKDFYEAENRLQRDDGSYVYVYDRGYIIRNKEGKPTRLIGASQDITERKVAELQIIETNLKYQAVIDSPMNGFVLSDKNGNIIDANETACKMFGFTKKELLLLNRKDILEINDPIFIEAMKTRNKIGIADAEVNGIRKNGEHFPMAFVSSRYINANGEERRSSLLTDITERKIAEKKVLVSEQRFKALVQNSGDLLGILDNEGNYLYVSPTSKKILGLEPEYFLGKSAFLFIHPDDIELMQAIFSQLETEKFIKTPPYRSKNAEGEWKWIESSITNLLEEEGINGIVVNSRDISEKKLAEDEAAQEKIIKQKEITEAVITAQESERSEIGRELHDNINQLLGATRLYIDMGKRDEKNKISYLSSASTYTLTAIEEIRKLSKTLITPLIKTIGLRESIEDIIEDITAVHSVKIKLVKDAFDEDLLNEKFKLNIFRIVQEQINNTLKHAKARNIKITIQQSEVNVFISIEDDGVGFDTTERKKGIGISNIISRAELYEGILTIQSSPGKGCKVSIDFPLSKLLLSQQ